MPGYVIHIAIANEYLRKHKNSEDKKEFIKGVIYPDSVDNKSLTHYGKNSSHTNLYDFLCKNNIDNSFYRGYFLHLYTDYLFYNELVKNPTKAIYNDYDILNEFLIEKYKVVVPDKVKDIIKKPKHMHFKYLSEDIIIDFIDKVSEKNLNDVRTEILDNVEKWTTFVD